MTLSCEGFYLCDRHRLGHEEDPKRSHTETSSLDQERPVPKRKALHAGHSQLPATSRSLFGRLNTMNNARAAGVASLPAGLSASKRHSDHCFQSILQQAVEMGWLAASYGCIRLSKPFVWLLPAGPSANLHVFARTFVY